MNLYTNQVCFFTKRKIKKLLTVACKEVGRDNISMTLSFVGEKKIRELNNKFRKVDRVTDVLSFPMEEEGGMEFPEPEGIKIPTFIGDVIICTKRARQQAKEYGHSYKRELSFLALHGFLHLLGYDHMNNEEEKQMMALTEKVLDKVNIRRKNV